MIGHILQTNSVLLERKNKDYCKVLGLREKANYMTSYKEAEKKAEMWDDSLVLNFF